MKLHPVKKIELVGGPACGLTKMVDPKRTKMTLRSDEKNERLVYEYDHTREEDDTEIFRLTARETLVPRTK